jgi:VanZ family protein
LWGDKLAHMATYLVLAFLVDTSWPERGFGLPKSVFLLGYGVLIELLQMQIPHRLFSLGDLAANLAGIVLYAFLIKRLLRPHGIR